jgi:hypothetical protein
MIEKESSLFYLLSDDELIVELETIPNYTDVKIVTSSIVHSPFYITYKLNCGKVKQITNSTGLEFEECIICDPVDSKSITLHANEYFYTKDKIAINIPVSSNYTGTRYTYFDGGLISCKFNYKDGKLRTSYYYRNDAYNTLEGVRIYDTTATIIAEYLYDNQENLIVQSWYGSDSKIFYTTRLPHDGTNST